MNGIKKNFFFHLPPLKKGDNSLFTDVEIPFYLTNKGQFMTFITSITFNTLTIENLLLFYLVQASF